MNDSLLIAKLTLRKTTWPMAPRPKLPFA